MKLDIINHVHNYSRCLAYQLSSLVLYQTKVDVTYILYHTADDADTLAVIEHFRPKMPIPFITRTQDLNVLRNRAAGRHEVAMTTEADWVWFTDTDHLFRRNCLDRLSEVITDRWGQPPAQVDLCFPKYVQVTEQPVGDKLIESMTRPMVLDVPDEVFWPYKMRVAIGGIQIATREACRRVGYVPWMRHDRPGNWDFSSDRKFRSQLDIRHSIDLPNICRIRHGTRGYKEIGTKL